MLIVMKDVERGFSPLRLITVFIKLCRVDRAFPYRMWLLVAKVVVVKLEVLI